MRAIFGVVGLLLALVIVGLLVKKQLATTRQAIPVLAAPAPASASASSPASADAGAPASTVRAQSQQIQQQYKQALEGAMQQARPVPDEK